MASQTTNYGLTKPAASDPVDVSVLNDNFDIIDTKIKEAADAVPDVATTQAAGIVKPDGTTVTVDQDGTIHGAQTYILPTATANTLGGIKVGENLTIGDNGKLNAYADIQTDSVPTQGSSKVPLSGGTYNMINSLATQVNTLASNITGLVTGLSWLEAVSTQTDIASTYPNPSTGDTVMCIDTGYVYQYDGTNWVFILAALVSVASAADVQAVLEV